jgi:hypothetical protein
MLDAALAYARLGLPVFPVWPVVQYRENKFCCSCGKTLRCENPGKHPMGRLVPRGLNDATTDEAQVRHLWACRADANIGIATGRVVVLDIDPRHDGDKTLADLEQKHGAITTTWRVATGGGGVHLYFNPDREVRSNAGALGPGLDVRGTGGYVIAPPSVHVSGNPYTWERAPEQTAMAPLPAWLLASSRAIVKAATPAASWRALVAGGVGEGHRNDAVTRLAGHLLRREVDPLVTFEFLLTWNAARCRPPLDETEVAGIVARIAERELRRREGAA